MWLENGNHKDGFRTNNLNSPLKSVAFSEEKTDIELNMNLFKKSGLCTKIRKNKVFFVQKCEFLCRNRIFCAKTIICAKPKICKVFYMYFNEVHSPSMYLSMRNIFGKVLNQLKSELYIMEID
jgi:hypothetical protein